MATVQVFDPPMCCPTGVCGSGVDPALARFSADMEWLREHGASVERYNLSQQPGAFAASKAVHAAMSAEGTSCLPMVLVDGEVVSKGVRPNREQLARWAGVGTSTLPTNVEPCDGSSSRC
jgi:hypothetical protein